MLSRLFFALDINDNDKEMIANWRDQLDLPFKAIAPENFHITLAFLGNVNAKQQQELLLKAQTANQQLTNNLLFKKQDCRLTLSKLALFKEPNVLYLGLKECPCWLSQLATCLSVAAVVEGVFQEPRPYLPHLSVFRKATTLSGKSISFDQEITVNSFSLYQSISSDTGVRYQPIKQWQLHQ
ncbi:RNA 2',3'-cyclic phosphodiesterase [Thalassotalea sp. PLHSN55]|uniref:RNA 2',3'-cyclic phosphodiesterase n=1 Tax=Thalassotalea sp. PLHSN55 TaxID=3435888 RepID=UPI003F86B283